MSDYQARKARALELQREKEEDLKRELAAKAAKEKQSARDEEARRKRLEAASAQARLLELRRANDELMRKQKAAVGNEVNGVGSMGYDPFAEDAKPVAGPSVSKPSTKPTSRSITNAKPTVPRSSTASSNKSTISRGSNGVGSSSGLHRKEKEREKGSPPALSRKEKAARALAASAKKSAEDSLFSVRALVESRESFSPGPTGAGTAAKAGGPSRLGTSVTTNGLSQMQGQGKIGMIKPPLGRNGSGSGSARETIKNASGSGALRKLCPDRNTRDRRSIDDIARDLKAKKGVVSPNDPPDRTASPSRNGIGPSSKLGSISKGLLTAKRDLDRRPLHDTSPRKRRASVSSTSTSDSDSPPAKRRFESHRRPSPPVRLHERSTQADVSAQIQAMFRRPGQEQKRWREDVYSDDESDMEAGLSDVELEEKRATRIARREDEEAEREEKERKARKEAQKRKMAKG